MNINSSFKKASNQQQFPIEYDKRHKTDICCTVIALILISSMIVVSILFHNQQNYRKSNFPSASDGTLCILDSPIYPFVYFANLPNIDRRLCVSKCPQEGDEKLQCLPNNNISCRFNNNSGYQVYFYHSQQSYNRNQLLCLPTNNQKQKDLLQKSGINKRNNFYNSFDDIKISLIISLFLSITFLLLMQWNPYLISRIILIGGILIQIAIIPCIALYPSNNIILKIIIIALLLLFLIIIGHQSIKHSKSIKFYGIFLQAARKVIRNRLSVLLYIPIFIIFMFLIGLIILKQCYCLWSAGQLRFYPSNLFYQFNSSMSTTASVFIGLQSLWFFTFIKSSLNFCISAIVVQQYQIQSNIQRQFNFCDPFKLILFKHIGSIITQSFYTGMFTIIDFLFDFITDNKKIDKNPTCLSSIIQTCANFFNFVRSDALAYIYATGNPYCQAARACESMCNRYQDFQSNQSAGRSYRFYAHMFIALIVGICSLYIKSTVSLYAVGFIMLSTILLCTIFISFHADAADAIQLMFLLQNNVESNNQKLNWKQQMFQKIEQVKNKRITLIDIYC